MYELLLSRLDSVAASLGLLRASARVKKGVNPWGYSNGEGSRSPRGSTSEMDREGEEMMEMEMDLGRKGSWESGSTECGVVVVEKGDRGVF